MEKPSFLEKVSGNVGTTIVATLIAASGGTYLAPLLPVLTGSLANGRYQRRVDSALSDLNNRLSFFEEKMSSLSDPQFQLICETVSSLMKTTSDEKIEILKRAVVYTANDNMLDEHRAYVMSRVLRDISVIEFKFLYEVSQYQEISVVHNLTVLPNRTGLKSFFANTAEDELLNSLTRLDLLKKIDSGMGSVHYFNITNLGHKLIEMCSFETCS